MQLDKSTGRPLRVWPCAADAWRTLGFSGDQRQSLQIRLVCCGVRASCRGFGWRFAAAPRGGDSGNDEEEGSGAACSSESEDGGEEEDDGGGDDDDDDDDDTARATTVAAPPRSCHPPRAAAPKRPTGKTENERVAAALAAAPAKVPAAAPAAEPTADDSQAEAATELLDDDSDLGMGASDHDASDSSDSEFLAAIERGSATGAGPRAGPGTCSIESLFVDDEATDDGDDLPRGAGDGDEAADARVVSDDTDGADHADRAAEGTSIATRTRSSRSGAGRSVVRPRWK